MLEYKAARWGRAFGKVDRFFPSTRMCSQCGVVGEKLALNTRSWTCPCGTIHDRDVNAARNIRAAGRADPGDRGAQVRPAPVPAPRREAVPTEATTTRQHRAVAR
jgi:putative transposase